VGKSRDLVRLELCELAICDDGADPGNNQHNRPRRSTKRPRASLPSLWLCCIMRARRDARGKLVATIVEWLGSLGLSEYAARFAENGIDSTFYPS
jgi:hypothetical protein